MSETLSDTAFLAAVTYNADGLVPAIAQDAASGDVLMLAWMTAQTLEETLRTGQLTYWSRSRNERWRKGATSGHTQELVEAYIDCDGDTLLFKVRQNGPACHTGARSCFYRRRSSEA
ncbi:MAG: phosphoribosyl-AMP cyclohydrolase [Alphaproteobacteria bacterium]|nr:phosphoribosyl-AMP cyclohydrolase [Alphaproteobacteria bacterium]